MANPIIEFWTEDRVEQLRALAASGLCDREIGELWDRSAMAIHKKRYRLGILSGYQPSKRLVVPADFSRIGPTLTVMGCVRHYRAAAKTVRTWYTQTGFQPAKRVYSATTPARVKTGQPFRIIGLPSASRIPEREGSAAGRAQLFLQRFGPVVRASVINPNASGWLMFGRKVSEEELISAAVRKGYRSEAMAA